MPRVVGTSGSYEVFAVGVCGVCDVIADGGVLLVCLDGRREAIFCLCGVVLLYIV